MAWQKLKSHTLTSAGDELTISFSTKQFIHLLNHNITDGVGLLGENISFNNDGTGVYAERGSNNGGADSTATSATHISQEVATDNSDRFAFDYICDVASEEKLVIGFEMMVGTAGAGTAPQRREHVAKYVPSPTANITRIDIDNTQAGNYNTGSNLSALGSN